MIPSPRGDLDYTVGLIVSIVGHFVLFALFFLYVGGDFTHLNEPVIVSLTLEGGRLGGMEEISDSKRKVPLLTPKKSSAPEVSKPLEAKKPEIVEKKLPPPETKKVVIPSQQKKPEPEPKKEPPAKPKAPKKEEEPEDYNKSIQQALKRITESHNAGGKGPGAAVEEPGKRGFGGPNTRPPEFFRYRDILEARIKSGWRWFDPARLLTADVRFSLSAQGEITDVTVTKSSGVTEFDDSVLRAVYKASPVPPPPLSIAQYFEVVTTTFESRQ